MPKTMFKNTLSQINVLSYSTSLDNYVIIYKEYFPQVYILLFKGVLKCSSVGLDEVKFLHLELKHNTEQCFYNKRSFHSFFTSKITCETRNFLMFQTLVCSVYLTVIHRKLRSTSTKECCVYLRTSPFFFINEEQFVVKLILIKLHFQFTKNTT